MDLFFSQMSDLDAGLFVFEANVYRLKKLKALGGFVSASSGIPGPPEEEALEPKARKAARTERRLRELLARMAYVFGWSCLEELLAECVRETLLAHPQRALETGETFKDGKLVRNLVVDGWTRDRVIQHLVDSAVSSFRRKSLGEMADYFERRLDVTWRPKWKGDLLRIVARRNEAAHSLRFTSPSADDISADLKAILRHGAAIARKVSAAHQIPYKRGILDKNMRGWGPLTR